MRFVCRPRVGCCCSIKHTPLASLARRRYGCPPVRFGPTQTRNGPTAHVRSVPTISSDASILMRMSFECVKCCFGTGARTLLLLAKMSLVEISTAMGSSIPTSVHSPAAMRAEAVLMPVYGQDYIKPKDVVFPRGEVPKKEYKPLILCVDTQARCLGSSESTHLCHTPWACRPFKSRPCGTHLGV